MSGKSTGVNKALVSFIAENAKTQEVNENKKNVQSHSLTQSQWVDAAKANGITEEALKAMHTFRTEFTGAAVHVLTDKLAERVKESKKAGDDPSDLTEQLKVTTHDGSTTVAIRAREEYQIPTLMQKPGQPTTSVKHGVITIKEKTTRTLEKEVAEHASNVISKLF